MRRYYVDIQLGKLTAVDKEGIVLPNLEAVQREALRILANVATELVEIPAGITVRVRDDDGPVMRVEVNFKIDRTN